ncbi:MAG: glycosyl transferase [Desulfobacterales bacterium RIFOXYA12_FULL_46_15]|nr:MAG: glycosyl transferase [Desulfobacterales bacterium RIFOXYA12_FULL_46_15]
MKILFVTTISTTINAFLIPHIKMLVNEGHQIDLACNDISGIDHQIISLGCKLHPIKFNRSLYDKTNLIAYRQIRKIVLKGEYELIHTHTPIASFLTRIACINTHNIKIIYTAHGFHFYKNAPLINWLLYYPVEKILSRYTEVIITINKEDYERAKKNFKSKYVRFVNGVGLNLDKFKRSNQADKIQLKKKYGYHENDFILIYAAEHSYRKHQDLLINAIKILKIEIPDIKLLLAGTGDLARNYQKQTKRLDIENHVHFLGYQKNINELLSISDIAVSSSRQEGLPVNIMEAMAMGLPVIATNCRGNRDLITHGYNGLIVDFDDGQQMAKAIKHLYFNKTLQITYGKNGLNFVSRYSIDKILKEMKKIYKCGMFSM